ncbi:MAG: peptidylprolyl isomerase [Candidatus Moraniibacteriota bacterium]
MTKRRGGNDKENSVTSEFNMPKTKIKKAEKPAEKEVSQAKEEKVPKEQDKTLLHALRLVIVAAVVIVFGLILVTWGTYVQDWQNNFLDSVYQAVPYPAAAVDHTHWVKLADFNENTKAMRRFLESKEAAYGGGKFDFSTPEGLNRLAIIKKNILNQLIENKMVEILAKKQGITVAKEEITDTAKKILSQEGQQDENLTQLNVLYGWNEAEFGDRVVKNMLLRERLEDKITKSGELGKEASDKVAVIKKKLETGEDFSEVAKNYSDSSSKLYGGLLPAFSQKDAPPELASAAFSLKAGEISQPLAGNNGWNFIKVERRFQENGAEKAEIRNIMVGKATFADWLEIKKKDFQISVYLKPYYWHSQMGKLFFKDDNLNQLDDQLSRENLNEKAQEADFLINSKKEPNKNQ